MRVNAARRASGQSAQAFKYALTGFSVSHKDVMFKGCDISPASGDRDVEFSWEMQPRPYRFIRRKNFPHVRRLFSAGNHRLVIVNSPGGSHRNLRASWRLSGRPIAPTHRRGYPGTPPPHPGRGEAGAGGPTPCPRLTCLSQSTIAATTCCKCCLLSRPVACTVCSAAVRVEFCGRVLWGACAPVR